MLALESAPRDLDGEEGIAGRGGMELREHGTVELHIQASTKQPIQCLDVQRPDGQPTDTAFRERSFELERKIAKSLPSPGKDEADRLLLETTSDELKRTGRGSIKPLHIVGGDNDRARFGEKAKHTEDAQ